MKKTIITLSAAAMLAFVSCSVKPYRSPDMSAKLDSLSNLLISTSEPTENIQALPWEKVYTDPKLQGYIQEALKNNHDLNTAQLTIEQSLSYLRAARAALSPTLSASVGASSEAASKTKMDGTVPLVGSATWEIDIWGKLNANKRAKKAQILSSVNNYQALQTSIISQTAATYFQLIAYDREREVIIATIDNRQQYLDTVTIMKKYGKVNEVAVQQAAATLAEVQTQLPKVELAIVKTENALAVLLGKNCPTKFERSAEINISTVKLFDKIPVGTLRNRPDVRAAEQYYRSQFELWNVSRAAMYPSLSLSAQGGIPDLVHSQILALNAIASLTQPIWNGRTLRTNEEVAKLEKQKAEIAFEKTVIEAGAEVSNAYTAMKKYYEISIKEHSKRNSYSKAYEYSYELFVNGYATYLDVLIAQEGVFSSDISLIESYLNTIKAQIELYRALGGGADSEMVDRQAIEYARMLTNDNKKK